MPSHHPYPKIPRRTSEWHEDERWQRLQTRIEWVATEKIHGANLCVRFDGVEHRVGKRRGWLEVLEHLEDPLAAAREVLRVSSDCVVASVPSKQDDNPEHIQLFDQKTLTQLFHDAGASSVQVSYVLNHMIAVVR